MPLQLDPRLRARPDETANRQPPIRLSQRRWNPIQTTPSRLQSDRPGMCRGQSRCTTARGRDETKTNGGQQPALDSLQNGMPARTTVEAMTSLDSTFEHPYQTHFHPADHKYSPKMTTEVITARTRGLGCWEIGRMKDNRGREYAYLRPILSSTKHARLKSQTWAQRQRARILLEIRGAPVSLQLRLARHAQQDTESMAYCTRASFRRAWDEYMMVLGIEPSIQESDTWYLVKRGATHERADNDDDDEGPGDIVEATKNNDERVC
ncbi:hypothetical protein DFP72DRAFT_853780 [Ephemerocybe angulata]|uniref:Uncharacterized protein n=1 Tax=Ephemerocybe angulata TaxID=980116 RepID=A0A8H6HJF0_9AGAR|nr:hypothetical protein DFP72DRAFT_853780 [Tulosesus angulatus]